MPRRKNDDPFDSERFAFFWQDPSYKPFIVNKSFIARIFDVDRGTVDRWIKHGAPILRRGSKSNECEISCAHFCEWHLARAAGLTVAEFRREQLAELAERERERVCALRAAEQKVDRSHPSCRTA